MLVFIDNHDSFTYNLVQYFKQLHQVITVVTSDATSLGDLETLHPSAIILGPGPGTPQDAGITCSVVRHFAGKLPLLGVCLGHQAIAQAFGATVVRAHDVMHGRTSQVHHNQCGLFRELPSPTPFTRYHSLIVDKHSLPRCLQVIAWTTEGHAQDYGQNHSRSHHKANNPWGDSLISDIDTRHIDSRQTRTHHRAVHQPVMNDATTNKQVYEIMAIAHQSLPIYGVQFHPESILSGAGMKVLQNFIELIDS